MRARRNQLFAALAAATLLAFVPACSGGDGKQKAGAEPSAPAPAASDAAAPTGPVVALIGASVTVGFVYGKLVGGSDDNTTASLEEVVRLLWGDSITAVQHGDLFMFRDPFASGDRQIEAALATKPVAVIAIDFLFWFAHNSGATPAERLERIDRGLAMLDRVVKTGVAVIVGDIPDMRGADPRMLSAAAIPDEATLAAINRRIEAFVAERDKVSLFPLAKWSAKVRASGYSFALAAGEVHATRRQLLQTDRLHASRLGMAAVADRLQPMLIAAVPALAKHRRTMDEILTRLEVRAALAGGAPAKPAQPTEASAP